MKPGQKVLFYVRHCEPTKATIVAVHDDDDEARERKMVSLDVHWHDDLLHDVVQSDKTKVRAHKELDYTVRQTHIPIAQGDPNKMAEAGYACWAPTK